MNCPNCDAKLVGLATFCWECENAVPEEAATTDSTPEARARLEDTRNEAEIQQAAKVALTMLGYDVSDMSQGRPTRQTPGIPDLYVQGHGVRAWLEMKTPGGRASSAQNEWIARELANGGNAAVACSEMAAVDYMEHLRRGAA